ncbi:hypothetical protein LguiA_012808 [Lonicera macranthoides]
MGRIEKIGRLKSDHRNDEEEEEEQLNPFNPPIVLSSDDDEEANQDLSLKIVEKAMLRACTTTSNRKSESGSDGETDELVTNVKEEEEEEVEDKKKRRKKKEKKKKKENIKSQDVDTVDVLTEAEKEKKREIGVDETVEINPVEKSDNVVLRKLLGQDCFICKKGGHRAKDCPEKYTSSPSNKICLKCGQSGHEMFSCKNDYSPDDLKVRILLVKYNVTCASVLAIFVVLTILVCFQEKFLVTDVVCWAILVWHAQSAKRNRESSNPTRRSTRENRDNSEARSSPNALGKARKRKKKQYEREFGTPQSKQWGGWNTEDTEYTMPPKSKRRGGWITEDPEDFPRRKSKVSGWGSPSTPTNRSNKMYNSSAGGHTSSSHSRKGQKIHFGSPAPSSSRSYQHRFSASRFGNSSGDGTRRNYDW